MGAKVAILLHGKEFKVRLCLKEDLTTASNFMINKESD